MVFALIFPRRPPSGSNKKFQAALAEAARAVFVSAKLTGDLYCRLVYFHAIPTGQDVDNIVKSILDALKGVVFEDDLAVVQCLACKIDTQRPYQIAKDAAPVGVLEELGGRLDEKPDHCLYLEVGQCSTQQVFFGPIDGAKP